MAASVEQKSRLRRMVGEVGSATYSDADLAAYIERYPCVDALGNEPYRWAATSPPSFEDNPDWTGAYDLNSAAAEIWNEKAATLAGKFDFAEDGQTFNVRQKFENAERMARKFAAKRAPRTISQRPEPWLGPVDVVGNRAEYP